MKINNMKKRTIFFSTLQLGSASLIAQPIFEQVNFFGVQVQVGSVTNATGVDADGADVTWDITSTPIQISATGLFGTSIGTPYMSEYPTADRCVTTNIPGFVSKYSYWRTSLDGLDVVAEDIGSGLEIEYGNPLKLLQFPGNYQESFSDGYWLIGSALETATWTYVGYGTLVTAEGTYTDVVKMHGSHNDRTIFWNTSPIHPILELDADNDGTMWVPVTDIGVTEQLSILAFNLYPSPANSVLNVVLDNSTNERLTLALFDAQMRPVHTELMMTGRTQVDISAVPAGMYFVKVGESVRKVLIE